MRLLTLLGLSLATVTLAAGTGGLLYLRAQVSEAVQAPRISLDMDPTGNAYDPATNTMTVGAIDPCLTSQTASTGTHNHEAHLVIQDVEDLIGWQVRLNYIGDQMRPVDFNPTPFTDSARGQAVGFVNLPIDVDVHRAVTPAAAIPDAPADGTNTEQTALFGATYNNSRTSPLSPDTPPKNPPDDVSYSAPNGGVLGSVAFQILGDESGQTLFMQLDDGNPNPPGSAVVIFDGSGIEPGDYLAESALSSGYHAEGASACAAVPTPTNEPSPSPGPTPEPATPGPPGGPTACKCFNPQVSSSYSSTDPGSHPDVTSGLSLGLGPDGEPVTPDDTGDYDIAAMLNFYPSAPMDSDVPDAAILGTRQRAELLGLLNNPCANQIQVSYTLMEGTTDITNTVDMQAIGTGNELALMAGDSPPFDGEPDVSPPPAVTKYPSFLNAIFDHDWVDSGPDWIPGNADDNNGPSPPIKPRFRAVGVSYLGFASLWMMVQELVFEPGTKLPQLPAFDPAYGYPSVMVIQTTSAAGSATPPLPLPITDSCSPLQEASLSYGVSVDNPDTPADEGGYNLRQLPADAGATVTSLFYAASQRDADGDGYENTMDPCPFHPDTVWNPRDQTRPIEGDSDQFTGQDSPDGIPDTCDPSPNEPSGAQPTDHDGDGFPNGGDNCPLVANPGQEDTDQNGHGEVVGDAIGDACDPNPGTPDGNEIVCVRIINVTVGGPGEAEVSDCLVGIPVCADCGGFPTPEPTRAPESRQTPEPGTDPAAAQTPTVAGVTALPSTGDGGGSVLPAPAVLGIVAGVVGASVLVGLKVRRRRMR